MQVTNLKLESNMKEELLEAIYGTVERLEQKVDELSVSTKNAGAENVPASNDITKLDKSINAMFTKEEEVRGKISKLRDAIVVFADLIKVELGKKEQRNKLLVDAVKQMKQEHTVTSKALQEKLEVMNKSPQKKVVTHRFEPTSKNVLLFIGGLALSLVISIWGNLTQWREHQDWEEADLKNKVHHLMRRDDAIPQVALTASVMDAMLELSRTGLGLVAVCDAQQQVQGVFTDGDLRRWLVGGGALTTPVNEAMTVGGTTLQSQSRAIDAKEILMKRKITAAPVVDENGKLTGAINLQDFYQAGII